MELDALRTLVGAVRAGSFAAVARERGSDPSSVYRQVREATAADVDTAARIVNPERAHAPAKQHAFVD